MATRHFPRLRAKFWTLNAWPRHAPLLCVAVTRLVGCCGYGGSAWPNSTLWTILRIVLQALSPAAELLVAWQRLYIVWYKRSLGRLVHVLCVNVHLRASNSDANRFCCYLWVLHFGSVPPDMWTKSVVCSSGRWMKEGGVVFRWKQSFPAAGFGGTVLVRTEVAHARRSLL